MEKDVALEIAYGAKDMDTDELLAAYAEFQLIVNNTPNHMPDETESFQNGLHAAMGLVTESGEILDAYKKNMYGKRKQIRDDNIREECGDIFYYLHALMVAYDITLRDIVADNVIKLANRYIERFEV